MGNALEVNELTKVYPQWRGESTQALKDVSFSIDKGEIVGFLGPNGAGKTTTIKCICGLVKPTSGNIKIFDYDGINNNKKAIERTSAVLEGNRNIYWRLTAKENLEFFAGLQGRSKSEVNDEIKKYLQMFDLEEKENTPARKLSIGMQQKLALSCALVRDTDLLLLDEPTLGLDVQTSMELRRFIKKLTEKGEKTVLLSSHDMNVVEDVCERVIIINKGEVVTDDKVSNLRDLFNVRVYEIHLNGNPNLNGILKVAPDAKIKNKDGKKVLHVRLEDPQSFYDIINFLQESEAEIDEVRNMETDLENIFMEIIEGGLQ
ncbi:MAG: ABC transporter ATP-binding protein [Thermoplasmatota archaeon]